MPIFVHFEDDDLKTYQEINDQMLAYTEREDFGEYCMTNEYDLFAQRRMAFLHYWNDKYTNSSLYHVERARALKLPILHRIKNFLLGKDSDQNDILQTAKLRKIQENLLKHLEEKKRKRAQK